MYKKIAILAVGKLGSELCVAGVDSNGNWIRPTTFSSGGWRQFYRMDMYDESGKQVIVLSNVVAIRLIRHIPQMGTPHIEDWKYDRSCKPTFEGKLDDSQRLRLFRKISEQSLAPLIEDQERSLCLIQPSSIVSADFANISYRGRYQPILDFTFRGRSYRCKVTDIYWRAIGRYLSGKGYERVLEGRNLHSILQYSRLFLTIGLTRLYKGKYWPMVVGVHTSPYFPVKIDYENV